MQSELQELCNKLDQLLSPFEDWQEPLSDFRHEEVQRRLTKPWLSSESIDSGFRTRLATLNGQFDFESESPQLVEILCSRYLDAKSIEREEIRAFVARKSRIGEFVWRYANHLATQIVVQNAGHLLALGLAAISIENCGSDYRDTMTTLADLFVAAENAGIDPRPFFESVAKLSSNTPTVGGCGSVSLMLTQIDSYAVLGERRRNRRAQH